MTTNCASKALATAAVALVAATAAACGSGGSGGSGGSQSTKVAFLMPDQGSTRYELHDRPGFEKKLKELCSTCTPLYNNADGDAVKQQQQFNSALAQGAKVVVIDPVDSAAAVTLVNAAHTKGAKVIAYDRPIPKAKVDFYVSFDNEKIGKEIATSLVQKVKSKPVPAGSGLLVVNGSPTDAAAGLIKKGIHEGVDTSGLPVLAEYDTIDWKPENAQKWVAGQISRFGKKIVGVVAANDGTAGGTIAAFKASGAGFHPTGQRQRRDGGRPAADHRGRPVQHHQQAQRDRRWRCRRGGQHAAEERQARGERRAVRVADQALRPHAGDSEEPQGRDHRQEDQHRRRPVHLGLRRGLQDHGALVTARGDRPGPRLDGAG